MGKAGSTDCALVGETFILSSNCEVLSRRIGTNSRGNNDGVPVGCAVTKTGGAAFSSLQLLSSREGKGGALLLASRWAI